MLNTHHKIATECIYYTVINIKTIHRQIMPKIFTYLRASTDKQDVTHQKYEILEYARKTI